MILDPLLADEPVTLPVTVPIVQANVEPVGDDVNVIAVLVPEQIVCVNGLLLIIGFGLTVTVYVKVEPIQEPVVDVGVIRYTTLVTGDVLVLVNDSVIGFDV